MTIDKALNQAPDKKPKIMRFASDTDKMIFDLESDIFSQLQEAFEKEKVNLLYWQVTCEGFYTPEEWKWWFEQAKYTGDHSFIYFE